MDLWGFLLLIVALGMWLGAKLTLVGLFSLGGTILFVTVFWWWRGHFGKGLASIPALLAVLGLWMGWAVGMISATPEYWASLHPQLQPIVSIFIK